MKKIKIIDVNLKIKNNHILKNINLEINQGETVAIIGPNGSGKTTLINTILKVQKITSGKIINDFENLPKYKIGSYSQEQSLPEVFTVKECLKLFLFEGSYSHLVKKYDLEEIFNRQIKELSTGEYKKLCLILLLENNPEIIFVDEVTTGLDVPTRKSILNFMQNEFKSQKKTLVLITHYLEEVDESAKLVFLKDGKIVEIGFKDTLFSKYGLQKKIIIESEDNIEDISFKFKNFDSVSKKCIQIDATTENTRKVLEVINDTGDTIKYDIEKPNIDNLYNKIMGIK
ncbi:MAG: ABC transporter ATP-binding protein [Methanobrevibacter sp.]|jgi:ABC-type multidrug transport system ATPase subunit|nr:ABC transporter ATP-binding protein [Candidatus Methanovirga aequatorialis]